MDNSKLGAKLLSEVLNGKELSEIPKSQRFLLKIGVQNAKSDCISTGNVQDLRKLQTITRELEEMEKNENSTQETKKKTTNIQSKPCSIEEEDNIGSEELESLCTNIMNGSPISIVSTDTIPILMKYCSKRVTECVNDHQLLKAQEYEDIIDGLQNEKSTRKKSTTLSTRNTGLTAQIQTVEEKIAEEENLKKCDLEKFDNETDQKLVEMTENFNKELQDFDAETNQTTKEFHGKRSKKVLNLRESSKFLIQARKFKEAAAVESEADAIEKEEHDLSVKEYLSSRNAKKHQIEHDQKLKVDCFLQRRANLRFALETRHNAEIRSLQRTVDNAKFRLPGQKPKIEKPIKTRSTTFVTQRLLLPCGRRPRPNISRPSTVVSQRRPKTSFK